MSAELRAALRFLARVDDAIAGELVSLEWGTGVFDRERPLVWDGNYVRAERMTGLEAPAIAESVESLFAERGLRHRTAVVHDQHEGERLAPGFGRLGWKPAHDVVMVSRRQPAAPLHPVERISTTEFQAVRRAVDVAEPPGDADPAILPELIDQLASRDELIRAKVAEQRFAVVVKGQPVSTCVLYSHDGVGQVELVITRPEHRNRGYARAVVSAAAAASQARGDKLTFLVALADDWPRELYERLGFRPAGLLYRFRRPPPQRRSSVPS
jgi:ribosomal protein S18 acetylase RimI-like enzyme